MKIKLRRSRKYVNYGAIPKKEYDGGSDNQTIETLLSPTEETEREEKTIVKQKLPMLPLKIWPQQFRQSRGGQKSSRTSLGWRTNRTLRRNAGSDNRS